MSAVSAIISASSTDGKAAATASISRLSDGSIVVSGSGLRIIGDTQTEDQLVPIVVIKHRPHVRIMELRPHWVIAYPSRAPERLYGRKQAGRRCRRHDLDWQMVIHAVPGRDQRNLPRLPQRVFGVTTEDHIGDAAG